jgi:hypothetical protein
MSYTKTHAERELEILEKSTPDAIIVEFKKEIIALCEAFGNSGQSGGSAPYTARAISMAVEKLMMQQTVAPLTGEESEWNDVSNMNQSPMFQNNRDSRVFKDGVNGNPYFIEAIVFDGDIGGRFTGCVESISCSQYIKSFPFYPKTFYVDVFDFRWKDKEEKIPDISGDWWTHKIEDENQLKEVFEYYDMKEIKNAVLTTPNTPHGKSK